MRQPSQPRSDMQDALLTTTDAPAPSPLWVIFNVGWPVTLQTIVGVCSSAGIFMLLSRCTDELTLAGYSRANVLRNFLGYFITWGFCAASGFFTRLQP